ncbi:MAG: helix-turn-helix transcriptional regulator [Planctomycetota bacterium]
MGDLAAALGCSREHLSRCFARELGTSPRDWIAEEKIRHASERLRAGDARLGIAALAAECGFSSLSRFDKVFKRVTGTTPSAYRVRPLS